MMNTLMLPRSVMACFVLWTTPKNKMPLFIVVAKTAGSKKSTLSSGSSGVVWFPTLTKLLVLQLLVALLQYGSLTVESSRTRNRA